MCMCVCVKGKGMIQKVLKNDLPQFLTLITHMLTYPLMAFFLSLYYFPHFLWDHFLNNLPAYKYFCFCETQTKIEPLKK